MGDRATVGLIPYQPQGTDPANPAILYLYSHWHGADVPQRVAQGIWDGRPRWGESSYMVRILFGAVLGDDLHTIDGFGVGLVPFGVPADAGRPLLLVDLRVNRVGFVPWGAPPALAVLPYDFDSYVGEARWP